MCGQHGLSLPVLTCSKVSCEVWQIRGGFPSTVKAPEASTGYRENPLIALPLPLPPRAGLIPLLRLAALAFPEMLSTP